MTIHGPGWEEVCQFASGGQGKLFKVRCPESVERRKEYLETLERNFRFLGKGAPADMAEQAPVNFISAFMGYMSEDNQANFGALKKFEISGEGPEARKAMERLQSEVDALNNISHPSILKLLHADVPSKLMITEYHSNGTLADNRDRFTGNVRASLEAFCPLVAAVAILHENGIIHRDIKPENIFVASDGRLVLGDFGIVFFQDEERRRLTSTFGEKVGTAEWMAPWANVRERLDEINPKFDVFPLGKVLWWMISGKHSLPYWYYDSDPYDLEIIFRRDGNPDMALVNGILHDCVVEAEEKCLSDAKSLLAMIEDALKIVSRGGQLLDDGVYRPCRVCGKGQYKRRDQQACIDNTGLMADVFRCEGCGHIEMFAIRR